MFNVLISYDSNAWESEARIRMAADRFLEYSGDEGAALALSRPDSLKALERVPCILMYEVGQTDPACEVVRVGQLKDIRVDGSFVTFRFTETGRLTRSLVVTKRGRLLLENSFELNRAHWAVKDGEIP